MIERSLLGLAFMIMGAALYVFPTDYITLYICMISWAIGLIICISAAVSANKKNKD